MKYTITSYMNTMAVTTLQSFKNCYLVMVDNCVVCTVYQFVCFNTFGVTKSNNTAN